MRSYVRRPGFERRVPLTTTLSERLQAHSATVKFIGIMNMALGASLGIYTGILLSALGARPLWNSSILGLLFLTSGLSSAAAFVHLVASDPYEQKLLARADIGFLSVELVLIAMFFIGLVTNTQAHMESALLLLSGPYAPVFWVFVIILGIVVPLIVQSMAVNNKVAHTPVAPVLVVLGGLILRFVVVEAGQVSHWTRILQSN